MHRSFPFQDKVIYTTNSYKYLGFLLTPSGEINRGLNDLKDRALRAYFSLKTKMGSLFQHFPNMLLSLFDTLIRPILLYNSDFCGCLKMPNNNPIANTQMKIFKEIIGVKRKTINIGTHLELGTVPLMLFAKKHCIKNWFRIHKEGRANELLLKAHKTAVETSLPWPIAVTSLLNQIGIGTQGGNEVHARAFC